MRVSVAWLRELVDTDATPAELTELLDFSGTKVEAVVAPGEAVAGVVVGEVAAVRPHPNADNLVLVDVITGGGTAEQVVCGARNFAAGDRVPYATVGARVAGVDISERRIRGEVSRGMLCSPLELGISKDHSGILVLPADAPVGEDASPVLGLDDVILELEITTNRPDCMGMVGIAREVAALTGGKLRTPDGSFPEMSAGPEVTVDIHDPGGCPRYVGVALDGITVGPAPAWMARRLLAAGVRSISNVVDVTNYVMLETGHPVHAFDAARVEAGTIVVRRAQPAESVTTLDGVDRSLSGDDLVIADPSRALALAGIMGGADSEVARDTTRVVIESAHFDPAVIAFGSRRHNLRTEASARFERGADPESAPVAAARAVRLLLDAGAGAAGPVRDAHPRPAPRQTITLRPARTDAVLGIATAPEDQAAHLRAVGFEAELGPGRIDAVVPSFRPDVVREVDLIEEVARLAGFGRIPATLPPGASGGLERAQRAQRELRRAFVSLGVYEAMNQSFGSPGDLDLLGLPPGDPARSMVELANPMAAEDRHLRTTLLPGLLRSAARNFAHLAPGVALFEFGRAYRAGDGPLPDERALLTAVFAGERTPTRWTSTERRWDFFAAKGVLAGALAAVGIAAPEFSPIQAPPWHPTRAAEVCFGGQAAGAFGELHPEVAGRFEVPDRTPVIAFELRLDALLARLPGRPKVVEPPRFPPVYIDVAVVVAEEIPAARVADVIAAAGRPEVASMRLFDLYRGDQVDAGSKSLAYALELRVADRTLTADEANAVRDRIVAALADATGARLR